jgi:hypothetical protein
MSLFGLVRDFSSLASLTGRFLNLGDANGKTRMELESGVYCSPMIVELGSIEALVALTYTVPNNDGQAFTS